MSEFNNERSESMMKWSTILRSTGNLIATVLFIVFVILACMIVFAKVSGQEPNFFGYQMKTVLSGSMEPSIETGSIIFIEQTEIDAPLKEGDVITFQTDENILVTHRIVEANGEEYITKGDNNNGIDVNPVLAQHVIGKYTGWTIPYLGYLLGYANTKLGSALMLILPGLFLIGYAFITIGRSLKQVENSVNKETIVQNDET